MLLGAAVSSSLAALQLLPGSGVAFAVARLSHGLWPGRQLRSRTGQGRDLLQPLAAGAGDMVSPFDEGGSAGARGKPKLPLTWENVEMVLDELRPYLRNDGGDCKIDDIDGPIVKLELQGSCSSCSASSVTLKMGIERTLMERIPEIAEVVSVMPNQEPLTKEGVEEVLNGIRPFLSVSGGAIELQELVDGDNPRITLVMSGPPLKSMAVKVEVVNRMKRKFPLVQDVNIVGEEMATVSA